MLPQIAVPAEGEVTAARLFGGDCPLHFEIGFGGGEHMTGRADMLPDHGFIGAEPFINGVAQALVHVAGDPHLAKNGGASRSEEHTSELQSLMRISYAVFCLKKKKHIHKPYININIVKL